MKVRSMDELIQGTTTKTSLLSTEKKKKNQLTEDVVQSDGKDKEISDKTVNVSQSGELLSLLTESAESGEREKRVAEIAKLVQSGKYFSSRKITDIAVVVDRRLDESVSTFSLLLGDDK